jgi:hypothetical protein
MRKIELRLWGISLAGRASDLQLEGHQFESDILHQNTDLAQPG